MKSDVKSGCENAKTARTRKRNRQTELVREDRRGTQTNSEVSRTDRLSVANVTAWVARTHPWVMVNLGPLGTTLRLHVFEFRTFHHVVDVEGFRLVAGFAHQAD